MLIYFQPFGLLVIHWQILMRHLNGENGKETKKLLWHSMVIEKQFLLMKILEGRNIQNHIFVKIFVFWNRSMIPPAGYKTIKNNKKVIVTLYLSVIYLTSATLFLTRLLFFSYFKLCHNYLIFCFWRSWYKYYFIISNLTNHLVKFLLEICVWDAFTEFIQNSSYVCLLLKKQFLVLAM